MTAVTVSPNFQVVIPLAIRESLGIRPGQKFQVVQFHDRIELIPVRSMRKARGLLMGIDTSVPRDNDHL